MADLAALYDKRFAETGLAKRREVWKALCDGWFARFVPPDAAVLDLACGYGEFIAAIPAARKVAVDLNPDAAQFLPPEVEFHHGSALDFSALPQAAFDVVFTSNSLEHFRDKAELEGLFAGVLGVLKPGGRFIVMGPNIRFAYDEYWDFWDHYLPLSDRSLAEGLALAGFELERVIDRFLPYTMQGRTPANGWLVRVYLRLPLAWKLLGKQFLVIARKPR